MCVMSLLACQNFFPGAVAPQPTALPGWPSCHHRTSGQDVPAIQTFPRSRNRFFLHRRSRPPAIERVIIGIDPLRQRIRQPRHRMRRFQHLPGIQWMKIRIVILQALRSCRESFRNAIGTGNLPLKFRKRGKSRVPASPVIPKEFLGFLYPACAEFHLIQNTTRVVILSVPIPIGTRRTST